MNLYAPKYLHQSKLSSWISLTKLSRRARWGKLRLSRLDQMVSINIEVSGYLVWHRKIYPFIVLWSDQNVVSFICHLRAEIYSSSSFLMKKGYEKFAEGNALEVFYKVDTNLLQTCYKFFPWIVFMHRITNAHFCKFVAFLYGANNATNLLQTAFFDFMFAPTS